MATTKTEAQNPQTELKRVTIQLFKDSGKYKDDVTVIYNGRAFQIKRGVKVEVPEPVAEILEQSMEQDRAAADYMDGLEEEYNQMRRFGM